MATHNREIVNQLRRRVITLRAGEISSGRAGRKIFIIKYYAFAYQSRKIRFSGYLA